MYDNDSIYPYFAVCDLAKKFPDGISETQLDKLREEYTDYQLADADELPNDSKVDLYWRKVRQINTANDEPRFPTLSKLMKV